MRGERFDHVEFRSSVIVSEVGEVFERLQRERANGRIWDEDILEVSESTAERCLGSPEFDADVPDEIGEKVGQLSGDPLLD